MNKNYFIFMFFEDLKPGDVFKFSKIIDSEYSFNKFFCVYEKNENSTKINTLYGKNLNKMELPNNTKIEVQIFINRKSKTLQNF